MAFNPDIHHRKSIRLKGYDYSKPGLYFVTVCTFKKEHLFGEIKINKMELNDGGEKAKKCWVDISQHYPNIILDEFVVMPNHIHGIIQIVKNEDAGAQNIEPLLNPPIQKINKFQHIIPRSLGSIIRGFKIGVTKWFRQNTDIYTVLQRNFYERIIKNEKEFYRIKTYIRHNPLKWADDRYYQ